MLRSRIKQSQGRRTRCDSRRTGHGPNLYSGGGYEIVQALIQDATRKAFETALQELVLRPAGMKDSTFAQPLPESLAARAATGHLADGTELPYGLGGAVSGAGRRLVLTKRGQNVGYQGYMMLFPETGQGIAVMTGSNNGTALAEALVRRAAAVYRWPPFGALAD